MRHQYGLSALVSQTSFRGQPMVESRNIVCFLSIYGSREKKLRMSGMRKGMRERLALLTRNGELALLQVMF